MHLECVLELLQQHMGSIALLSPCDEAKALMVTHLGHAPCVLRIAQEEDADLSFFLLHPADDTLTP